MLNFITYINVLNKTSYVGSFITFYCFNTLIINAIDYFYSMDHL